MPENMKAEPDGRVAVIDIGSNTVRLVVYDKPERLPFPCSTRRPSAASA